MDVAIIGADSYYATCKLKRAQFFVVSMRDLEYHKEKRARPEIDPKIILPAKYVNLMYVFFKKRLGYTSFLLKIWSWNHSRRKTKT